MKKMYDTYQIKQIKALQKAYKMKSNVSIDNKNTIRIFAQEHGSSSFSMPGTFNHPFIKNLITLVEAGKFVIWNYKFVDDSCCHILCITIDKWIWHF